MEKKIGLVLSGGGVRGIAHIGLLKALEENGIRPSVISGASAGAVVGALYAAGYSPETMLEFFKTTPLFKFSFYSSKKPGLLDSHKYRVFFEKYFPVNDFSALQKTLYVATTDLANAQSIFFSEGELINPLLASASLPLLFTPVEIGGKLLADGGIMNNFPIEPLRGQCSQVIGSFVNPVNTVNNQELSTTTKVIMRATDLRFYANSKDKFPACQYVFKPAELSKINLLDTKKMDAVFEIGYKSALAEMDRIKEASAQPDEALSCGAV